MPDFPILSAPTTSIFEVFGQVDRIEALLQQLASQAPSYSQFRVTLQSLSQQITSVQQQSIANSNQIQAVLLLIEAILAGMGTVLGQNQILASLKAIEEALAPTAPKTVGLDTTVVETEQQLRPTRTGP